jgi:hypothetical protein
MRSPSRIPVDCRSSALEYTSAPDYNNPLIPNRKRFHSNALRHFYVPFVRPTDAYSRVGRRVAIVHQSTAAEAATRIEFGDFCANDKLAPVVLSPSKGFKSHFGTQSSRCTWPQSSLHNQHAAGRVQRRRAVEVELDVVAKVGMSPASVRRLAWSEDPRLSSLPTA